MNNITRGKIMLRETDDSPTLSFVSHEQFDEIKLTLINITQN